MSTTPTVPVLTGHHAAAAGYRDEDGVPVFEVAILAHLSVEGEDVTTLVAADPARARALADALITGANACVLLASRGADPADQETCLRLLADAGYEAVPVKDSEEDR